MASGSRGGSKTVLEETELDPSWDSPKDHEGYILSGDNHANQITGMKELEDSLQNLHYDVYTWTDSAPAKPSARVEAPRGQTKEPNVPRERTQPRKTIRPALKPQSRTRLRDTSTQPQNLQISTQPIRIMTALKPQTSTWLSDASEPVRSVKTPGMIPKTRAYRVKTVLEQTPYKDQLFEIVRRQFPDMRKFMKNRFPGDSFGLALRKVNFEKVQEKFSDVFRLKKLISLGDSICVLFIGEICQGSGFVLVGDFILTNAHLLHEALSKDGRTLTVPVTAVFNYEDKPVRNDALLIFETCVNVIDLDWKMDYAVLCLNNRENKEVPPGLLPYFAPKPDDGGACLIGHPGGNVKKIDLTCIIGKNERQNAANQQLEPYDDSTRMVIVKKVEEEGIGEIWCTDVVITYNTSNMFHGSSGSPLFDGEGRVVGLHSGGFVYDYEGHKHSVIVYARAALDIFSRFVFTMGSMERVDLLEDIKQSTNENPHVMEIFRSFGLV